MSEQGADASAIINEAIALLSNVRTTDPLDPVEQAVMTLKPVLASPSAAAATVQRASFALMHAASTLPATWDASIDLVVSHALTCAQLPWTTRCFVAKKLPTTLEGQDAWATADVIKQRTTVVVEGLLSQAELTSCSVAQELRVVSDALCAILQKHGGASTTLQIIAKRLVMNPLTFRAVLPQMILSKVAPPAFYCAVESALCALTTADTSRSIEAELALLPASFEGKGAAALQTLVMTLTLDAEQRVAPLLIAAKSKGTVDPGDDGVALRAFITRVEHLLKQGDANPSAFRVALSQPESIRSLLQCWGPCAQVLITDVPEDGTLLTLLRHVTLLLVYSGISQADARSLLNDDAIVQCLGGAIARDDLQNEEGGNLLAIADFDPCRTNLSCLECVLLIAKKLFVAASLITPTATGGRKATKRTAVMQGVDVAEAAANHVNPEGSLAPSDTVVPPSRALQERFRIFSTPVIRFLDEVAGEISIAEKILQQQANSSSNKKKRGRDDDKETVPDKRASGSDDVFHSLVELRSYANVVDVTQRLARFHARGVDHKVSPSWLS